jgi:ubiquinone/menaquinone biosynthesis C-methylase UbiE
MIEIPAFVRCPITGESLVVRDEHSVVSACGAHEYPVVQGILDLRLFDAPYMDRAHERSVAARLAEAAKTMDYAGLVRHFETDLLGQRPSARVDWGIGHRLALPQRAPARLRQMVDLVGGLDLAAGGTVLDLGCGSGEAASGLIALGAGSVVGIDISLTELVMGRKLLEEQGIDAYLVAGCAESLPFADGLFDLVFSPDVIEHVADQSQYLGEARRVLKPGGQLLMNSPNRYSLMAPEPHVGIWGLAALPRAWVSPVCRLLGKGPYTGKRLVSLPELRRLLGKTFERTAVYGRPANPKPTSLPGRLYAGLAPGSENLYAHICPEHTVVARREA